MRKIRTGAGRAFRHGNCLVGALWLCWQHRTYRLKIRRENGLPHFYVRDRYGRHWHFRYESDWMPPHLWWFWYKGTFARLMLWSHRR